MHQHLLMGLLLFRTALQRVQRVFHIAQRADDGCAVIGQQFLAARQRQVTSGSQPAIVENRGHQTGRQVVDGVVQHVAHAVAAHPVGGRQPHRGQHGGACHRHIGIGRGQTALGRRHVRTSRQQVGGQPGFDRGCLHGRQRHRAHRQLLRRPPQQHGQRGQALVLLLLAQRQYLPQAGHQRALLRGFLRRRAAHTVAGLDQPQHPLGRGEVVAGNGHALAPRHRAQVALRGAGHQREQHGIVRKHGRIARGHGRKTRCTFFTPYINLVTCRKPHCVTACRGLAHVLVTRGIHIARYLG